MPAAASDGSYCPWCTRALRWWGWTGRPRCSRILKTALTAAALPAPLLQADLRHLPFADGSFDLAISINVINHGYAATFRDYCRELDRVLKVGGHLFITGSPRAAAAKVRLPQTRELEPGTLVHIATPDGDLVHHLPTPEELLAQFPGYEVRRWETILTPIPFMGNVELPQFALKGFAGQTPPVSSGSKPAHFPAKFNVGEHPR